MVAQQHPALQGHQVLADYTLPVGVVRFLALFWDDGSDDSAAEGNNEPASPPPAPGPRGSRGFTLRYLEQGLKDVAIEIGHWEEHRSSALPKVPDSRTARPAPAGTKRARRRKMRSHHPAKVSFPGLQSHAPCSKTQTYFLIFGAESGIEAEAAEAEDGEADGAATLLIEEKTRLHGIPYADYFFIEATWLIQPASENQGGGGGCRGCRVRVGMSLTFTRSTWLRKAIESNTFSECKQTMELWREMAAAEAAAAERPKLPPLSPLVLPHEADAQTASRPWADGRNPENASAFTGRFGPTVMEQEVEMSGVLTRRSSGGVRREEPASGAVEVLLSDEEEDEEFYDCEATAFNVPPGGDIPLLGVSSHAAVRRRGSGAHDSGGSSSTSSPTAAGIVSASSWRAANGGGGGGMSGGRGASVEDRAGPAAAAASRATPAQALAVAVLASQQYKGQEGHSRQPSRLSMAGSLHSDWSELLDPERRQALNPALEVLLVLGQYAWSGCSEALRLESLAVYFKLDQEKVLGRIGRSLVPGMHGDLAAFPDLWAPLMLAFTLAQVFLFCTDVVQHHCRRETMLGTSLAVSFGTWLGTALFYYVVAFFMASRVRLIQSITVTGYGLFGWCAGLIISHALAPQSALAAAAAAVAGMTGTAGAAAADGGAAAAADGGAAAAAAADGGAAAAAAAVAASAPIDLDGGLPIGGATFGREPLLNPEFPMLLFGGLSGAAMGCVFWQQTPVRTRGCKACLVLPKLLCFLIVACTHYQFLRYLHHQFLPGTQRLCEVGSLVKPREFADILTQKELRRFIDDVAKTLPDV